jgi:hypothetical protein
MPCCCNNRSAAATTSTGPDAVAKATSKSISNNCALNVCSSMPRIAPCSAPIATARCQSSVASSGTAGRMRPIRTLPSSAPCGVAGPTSIAVAKTNISAPRMLRIIFAAMGIVPTPRPELSPTRFDSPLFVGRR